MSRLEGLLGLGTVGAAAISGAVYGAAYAKGIDLSKESLYLLPSLGAVGFYLGARSNHPKGSDVKVGSVYAGVTAAIGGLGFVLGYAVEKIIE
ncbi:MAG: hypothetical protein AABX24_05885 [Nanoarchaeota archaeon]